MTLLADGEGGLEERHDILCLNGLRYLLEPMPAVSLHAQAS